MAKDRSITWVMLGFAVMVALNVLLYGRALAQNDPAGSLLSLPDGTPLRLAGIDIVRPPPNSTEGRQPLPAALLAKAAATLMAEFAAAGPLRIEAAPRGLDRYGRLTAHIWAADGRWLQGALLEAGLARVMTADDDRAYAADMLAIEDAAREAGRGLWALSAYRPRSPIDPGPSDHFVVIEGKIAAVSHDKGQWRLSFATAADPAGAATLTAIMTGRTARACHDQDCDPAGLEGVTLRIRGWLYRRNGQPLLDLTHREQIQIIPAP